MICVSVQQQTLAGCLEAMKNVPMVELRADLCKLSLPELEEVVASHPNLLVTCRIANSSVEFAKEQIITAIRKGAKYVDVEIEAPVDFLEYVKVYAQVNGAKLIISYHDFEGTPSLDQLQQIADLCRRKGADIVKIVTTAHDISDAVRTLKLYKMEGWAKEFTTNNYSENKDVKLLAFSMGKAGQFSRYLSLKLGAPYTYCAYTEDSATASGQYTVAQMQRLLEEGSVKLNYSLSKSETSIPCSKSVAQRAILASAFAKGVSLLTNFEPCNDINGAIKVIEQFGCGVTCENGELVIKSGGVEQIIDGIFAPGELLQANDRVKIVTGESGLLTRLLIPFAAYASGVAPCDGVQNGGNGTIEITGYGSILGRNLGGAAKAVVAAGAECKTTNGGYLPFELSGGITARKIVVDGSESSQTVSGFLMTLPLLPHNTILQIDNPASTPYIRLTLDMLDSFGIEIHQQLSNGSLVFYIEGNQQYMPRSIYMEPDWSSASFFAVAYAIASMMGNKTIYKLLNMPVGTAQADEAVLEVLKLSGAKVDVIANGYANDIEISAPDGLKCFEFDATDAPDLFPILTVLACFCSGCSVIKGVNRLLQKESNRAESIFTEFVTLGADIDIRDDYMYINGGGKLHGGNVHSHNDHRIAMSVIVASLFIGQQVVLDEIKCIDKSFPSFLTRFSSDRKF